jgi:type III secretory pathway lipoprotein EscJ
MSDLALPAGNARQSLALTEQGRSIGTMLDRVRAFTDQPAIAKSLPAIGLLALLGLAAIIWMAVSEPPQRNLFQGLADGDKASVADTLKGAGIAYAIDRDTGALSVSEGDFYQAKMLLAQQGLPKSAPDGDALISSLPMGASRAVEGERLRGAHELDLARTIEAIDAVESAKVHLAVEQPSVFLRDRSEPGASVMLRLRSGQALSDSQVQAIVHLVASSVRPRARRRLGRRPDRTVIVAQRRRRRDGSLRTADRNPVAHRGALHAGADQAAHAARGARQFHCGGPCRSRLRRGPGDARDFSEGHRRRPRGTGRLDQ